MQPEIPRSSQEGETSEARKLRLKGLILEFNEKMGAQGRIELQHSSFDINFSFDCNNQTLETIKRQLEGKESRTPKEEKDLRLYRFLLSGNSVDLESQTESPAAKVLEPEPSVNSDKRLEEAQFRSTSSIVVPDEEVVSNKYLRSTPSPDSFAVSKEEEPSFGARLSMVEKSAALPSEPVETNGPAKAVEASVEAEAPEEVESTGSLFQIGDQVFYQGKPRVIQEVTGDGKYRIVKKVFGVVIPGITELVDSKELERQQFEKGTKEPEAVAHLFRVGQVFYFVKDKKPTIIFELKNEIKRRVFGELRLGYRTRNIDMSVQTLCLYLSGKTEPPDFPDEEISPANLAPGVLKSSRDRNRNSSQEKPKRFDLSGSRAISQK